MDVEVDEGSGHRAAPTVAEHGRRASEGVGMPPENALHRTTWTEKQRRNRCFLARLSGNLFLASSVDRMPRVIAGMGSLGSPQCRAINRDAFIIFNSPVDGFCG